jgi:hypothetical protein
MRIVRHLTWLIAVVLVAAPVLAQTPVSADDITRLENSASVIRQQLPSLRQKDASLASEVEKSLGDISDDITYLRVKLRREGAVSRDDYNGLRDRLETLRIRAQGQADVGEQPTPTDSESRAGIVPVGTQLDVRLQTSLTSSTATVEQRFEATTVADYSEAGKVVIPAGTLVRGYVGSVKAAGKIDRRGSLTLAFDELRLGARSYRLRASVLQALDPKSGQDNARLGAGAAVGAIIGGILGGGKGALLGVLVGGGGTMAATEGSDVDLPAGTILRIRLDEALELGAK